MLGAEQAAVLDRAFLADLLSGRYVVLPVNAQVVVRSLDCVRRHRLRGADAIQLASALLTREADTGVNAMAVFDHRLRAAAEAEGLTLLPEA